MGDRHAGPIIPKARIDDFELSVREKDLEILRIARENNVDAIIEAGDFFEEGRTRLPNEYIKTMLSRWFGEVSLSDVLRKKDELSDEEFINYVNSIKRVKIIGVAGNHELQGGAKETLSNTTLGLINSLGYIDLPSKDSPIILKDENTGKTIAITSTSYHPLMDNPEHIDDYIVDKKLGDFHIHIVHGMLVAKPLAPNRIFTTVDQIKDRTCADLTICGHIHTGFKTIYHNGKYFMNPGAVVRLTASNAEMERSVHVTLCEITDKIKLTDVPLKSAKPASEVLSRDHILQKRKNKTISEFYDEEIENFQISTAKKIDDILNNVLDNEGIPEELKQTYLDKVNAKKSSIGLSIPPQKDAWIKSIRLKNFQSHADQLLTFSPGMNLLVGESDNGKSAILRAIYWVFTGKPSGTSIVRYGEDFCEVEIELGNGTKVQHKLVVKETDNTKSKSNTYKITYPDGTEEEGNTRLLEKVQEVLGYCPFQIEDGKNIDINFMRQGEGWFLIGDEVSAPQRAKIVGAIMDTNCVDACMRDCDKDIQYSERQISLTTSEITSLTEQEAAYGDLEDKKKLVQDLKKSYTELQAMNDKIKKIQKLNEEISDSKQKIDDLSEIIVLISKFNYEAGIKELQDMMSKIISVSDIYQKISNCAEAIKTNNMTISSLSEISDAQTKIDEISKIIDKYSVLSGIFDKLASSRELVRKYSDIERMLRPSSGASDKVSDIEGLLNKIISVSDISTVLNQRRVYARNAGIIISKCEQSIGAESEILKLKGVVDKVSQIDTLRQSIVQTQKAITMDGYEIKKREKELSDIENKKADILSEFEVCPVCGNEIINGGHNHG